MFNYATYFNFLINPGKCQNMSILDITSTYLFICCNIIRPTEPDQLPGFNYFSDYVNSGHELCIFQVSSKSVRPLRSCVRTNISTNFRIFIRYIFIKYPLQKPLEL